MFSCADYGPIAEGAQAMTTRRVLFVSEVVEGGSPRSQRELASQLRRRGHDVLFLVPSGGPQDLVRRVYYKLSNASMRREGSQLAMPLRYLRKVVGRRMRESWVDGLPHLSAAIVQNALPMTLRLFRPDVVVVNSVSQRTWQLIARVCTKAEVASILYIREDVNLNHVSVSRPDALAANAISLTEALKAQGHACAFIPSVVDTSITKTESSRRVVLAINPDPSRGAAVFWAVAERLPQVHFVMQESWPISGTLLADVQANVSRLPNTQFRRRVPPGPALYRDARVVMMPYKVNNRPRVILEAHANGIPVIVADTPGLVEAVGSGGLVIPLEAIDAWVEAIQAVWDDPQRYAELSRAAFDHSQRAEVNPVIVTEQFEELMTLAVKNAQSRRGRP